MELPASADDSDVILDPGGPNSPSVSPVLEIS